MAMLTEDKNKPSLWNQALKVVKGDSTNELVEQFTQEMTLIAEGLCEDQARLRKAVDGLIRETEGQREQNGQDIRRIEKQLSEHQQETARQFKELSRRVEALERPHARRKDARSFLTGDALGRITLLASIICGTWLAVTVLNLLL